MSKNLVTIVDYECGNIYSLNRILEKLNYKVEITNNPEKVNNADKIILPGVGAFSVGMENLKKNGLQEAIKNFLKKGNFLLGICLGMQLLMKSSDEFGKYKGLSLINGKVISLEKKENFPIPHIGWSSIEIDKKKNENKIISEIKDKSYFYFIHSFKVLVDTNAQLLSAAYKPFFSVIGVPIAQRPRPGGKNFIVKILSYISCADFCACQGFHPN